MNETGAERKIIVLTGNEQTRDLVVSAASDMSLVIERQPESLFSYEILQQQYLTDGNTGSIRRDLTEYVRVHGQPYLMVLEFQNVLVANDTTDPEHLRLFRTILLSFVIMSMGRETGFVKCNSIVIFDDVHAERAELYGRFPMKFLDLLQTGNAQINEYVQELKKDFAAFNRIFSFKCVVRSSMNSSPEKVLGEFINITENRLRLVHKVQQTRKAEMVRKDDTPARVLCMHGGQLYVDGEISENDNTDGLTEHYIVIDGLWTGRTQRAVIDKVKRLIQSGVGDYVFKPENPLVIELGESSIIDGATAVILAQFLTTDLGRYRKAVVRVTEKNAAILQKSHGYSLVRSYIRMIKARD